MSRSILIVDDDVDFSALLTGVFEQAQYQVKAVEKGADAFAYLESNPVDLVVTDQRLPGMSGLEFIRKLDQMEMDLPIIMVSGYLDDDSIRELIRNGIDGIFMKPLNIFSLLKKASDLIESRLAKQTVRQASPEHKATVDVGAEVSGMPMVGGIKGLSARGRDFLRRALDASAFKRNLLLIGPKGTMLEEIGRDLIRLGEGKEIVGIVHGGQVDRERIADFFDADGKRATTLIVLNAGQLTPNEVALFDDLVEQRGATATRLRLILCLADSVENLYDKGAIDEDLYMFFGANELQVPSIKEMPEDLVDLVRQMLQQCGPEVRVDTALRLFLTSQQWQENMVELRAVTLRAISLAQPMPPQLKHFEAALRGSIDPMKESQKTEQTALERFLRKERQRYLLASECINGQPVRAS